MAVEDASPSPGGDRGPSTDAAAADDDSSGGQRILGVAFHDPDGTVWRRGARLAIAVPIVLAVCLSIGAKQQAAFAVFGCVGVLGMADFGGPRPRRAVAYLELVAVGAVYVAIGTLCSQNLIAAVVGMAVITFVTRMAGVFGGYAAAGNISALLAFVLAVMTPGGPDVVLARELGWIGGGLFAVVMAMTVLPRDEKRVLAHQAAAACRAMASAIRRAMAPEDPTGERRPVETRGDATDAESGLQAVRDLRIQLLRTPFRPAGPGRHDQLLLHALDLLERGYPFALRLRPEMAELPEEGALAEETAVGFDTAARMLDDGVRSTTARVDVDRLTTTREEHRSATLAWARRSVAAAPASEQTIERIDAVFPLRVLAGIAEQLGLLLDASVPHPRVDGAVAEDALFGAPSTPTTWAGRAERIIGSHLRWSSAWFRSSIRGSIAIAASVAVAQLLGVDHSFWIVLGTMSVLRSNVLTTGSSALQAVAGTFIGFVLATLFMVGFDGNTVALWIALPILCFFAMWLAGAIGLVAGQAGFALLVVVLFNIIVPTGWETGLQRVETVAIGAAVGIVAGLLFWPRGAEAVLRSDVAAWYRAARDHCATTVRQLRGDDVIAEREAAELRVERAQNRAVEAFDEYLYERGTKHEPWASWGPVLRMPAAVMFGAHTIGARIDRASGTGAPGCRDASDAIELISDRLSTALTMEAEILEHPGEMDVATLDRELGSSRGDREPALLAGLSSVPLLPCLVASLHDDDAFTRAFVLVWAENWLTYLLHATSGMTGPLAEVTVAADRSWLH